MSDYRQILCATDFSPQGDLAVRRAADLAAATGGQLALLHVIEHFPVDHPSAVIPPENVDPEAYRHNRARERLEAVAAEAGVQGEVACLVRETDRAAKQAILATIEERRPDLVVVGSHGHQGVMALLGATVDRVLHAAACDVLVVRPTPEED